MSVPALGTSPACLDVPPRSPPSSLWPLQGPSPPALPARRTPLADGGRQLSALQHRPLQVKEASHNRNEPEGRPEGGWVGG